jgi:hypothetical protein
MGICTVGAELFHEERQDRHDKANGIFRNFAQVGLMYRNCCFIKFYANILVFCN